MHAMPTIEDEVTKHPHSPSALFEVKDFNVTTNHETGDVIMDLGGHRDGGTAPQRLVFRLDEKCARRLSIDVSAAAYRLRLASTGFKSPVATEAYQIKASR